MTIDEYKTAYAGLSPSQVRRLAAEDSDFRVETEVLYRRVTALSLNKNCSDCWVDAYVAVMKSDPDAVEKRASRMFDLKAGALLIDRVKGDNSRMCTMHNITDELAIYHLRTNPGCIRFFSRYPENWRELVEASGRKTKAQAARKTKAQSGRKKPAAKKGGAQEAQAAKEDND